MTDGPRLNDGEYDVQMVVQARQARHQTWGGAEYYTVTRGPLEENILGRRFLKLYHREAGNEVGEKFALGVVNEQVSEQSLGWE
ncbi:hypothetical protein LTS10_003053 [Elasticomyces elasticus]|nr:hypothetical protein LTS10_003053 [Elasticomyces elasticus]